MSQLPGALVISLDFELHWGVRDRMKTSDPGVESLYGARKVIPRLLQLFEEYDIAATWATVGFLFARSRKEIEAYSPVTRPTYDDVKLDSYHEQIGENEDDDPLHYAPSLIEQIRSTPRQELATHTFSHYYCLEAGQTAEQFAADLKAAQAIAQSRGSHLSSIVYPRNQHNPSYISILKKSGIRTYRGNPTSWMWKFDDAESSRSVTQRVGRLVDSYVNITGHGLQSWDEVLDQDGLANVRASALLRPFSLSRKKLEPLRLQRIRSAIRTAARSRKIFHLWWHPHNLGLNQDENLLFLRGVLDEFSLCRDSYGMRSFSMADIGSRVLGPADLAEHKVQDVIN